ncbi:non-ribosomal peptide synthetase [Streptomyces sp. H27-D2]|uniref:non-ribosomal peptide synthetase n=1 Tax=Streptomyces sp. H27-D2 TaxID=3046304 RepID=UPI002DB63BA6|nr:non-ribosomal peptide synthetase [Streptomyces sp. H27-D2]MEC4020334.1 non-ribosomal peptide synthetase [Streptomyces sp. H27-D2]
MQHSITGQYLARYQRLARDPGGPRELLPVTGAQRRFLLVRALDPQGRPDIVPLFFAFPRGTVDLARMRRAAGHLATLHPALRARPEVVRGAPVHRLTEADVPVERVETAPGEDSAAALRRTLRGWSAQGSPLRIYLASAPDASEEAASGEGVGEEVAEEILTIALDHAACDGQSLSRVTEELSAAYSAGSGPEDVAPARAAQEVVAYREAVLLQLDAEGRASAPGDLAYWGERLRPVRAQAPEARAPEAGALPTGGAELRLPAAEDGAPPVPFPALLDACASAARALYGEDRVSPLGYPWGGRPAAAQPVLGCFLNTVVFPATAGAANRTAAEAGPESLYELSAAWWDDLDHADTPYDEVVHAAREAGAPWSGRLDGLLTVEDLHRRPLRLGGVTGREVYVNGRPVRAPFAVSVSQGDGLLVRMVWDRAVLDDDRAADAFGELTGALSGHLRRLEPSSVPQF